MYVVFCALVFSLLSTAVQMMLSHRKSHADIHSAIKLIEESYTDSIASSLYSLDEEQLRIELKGILNFQHIEYVELVEKRGETGFFLMAGDKSKSQDLVHTYDLQYSPSTIRKTGVRVWGETSPGVDTPNMALVNIR